METLTCRGAWRETGVAWLGEIVTLEDDVMCSEGVTRGGIKLDLYLSDEIGRIQGGTAIDLTCIFQRGRSVTEWQTDLGSGGPHVF